MRKKRELEGKLFNEFHRLICPNCHKSDFVGILRDADTLGKYFCNNCSCETTINKKKKTIVVFKLTSDGNMDTLFRSKIKEDIG